MPSTKRPVRADIPRAIVYDVVDRGSRCGKTDLHAADQFPFAAREGAANERAAAAAFASRAHARGVPAAMVVLAYDAAPNAPQAPLPTFSSAPFFFDRCAITSDGAPELAKGALLADAKHTQPHSNPRVSYYFPVGVSDYVGLPHSHNSTMASVIR